MVLLRVILFISILWKKFQTVDCASAFVLSSSEDRSSSSFKSRQEMCFLEGKVLFHNLCYELNTQGPCKENERVVLDSDAASRVDPIFQPICLEKACQNDDIYWAKDNYCYTQETAKNLCQTKGTTALRDMFGEGYCDCKKSPAHARMPNTKGNAPCYELYTRAQCKQNHILVERHLRSECILNSCSSKGTNFIPWQDGKCYRLGTRGPCNKDEEFTILDHTRHPGCRDLRFPNPLYVVDIPLNCKPDHGGECAQEFSVERGEQFRFQLLRSAERAKKRKKKSS